LKLAIITTVLQCKQCHKTYSEYQYHKAINVTVITQNLLHKTLKSNH